MKTLYLLDASGLIFRSFYAMSEVKRSDEMPIGAVFGFCSTLFRMRDLILEHSKDDETILWAGVFDVARRNFRHDIYPDYKGQRRQLPQELVVQFPLVREACQAFGCPLREVPNFEADDVIASYTSLARSHGYRVVILSDDKDFMQLYGPDVEIYRRGNWIREQHIYDEFETYNGQQVPDIQALAGDHADWIPGVRGIGIKTAADLIKRYGSLEALLAQVHTVKPAHRRELLESQQQEARISLQLATLRQDVDVTLDEEAMAFPRLLTEEAVKRMQDFCEIQEFHSLKKRIATQFATQVKVTPQARLATQTEPVTQTKVVTLAGGSPLEGTSPSEQISSQTQSSPQADSGSRTERTHQAVPPPRMGSSGQENAVNPAEAPSSAKVTGQTVASTPPSLPSFQWIRTREEWRSFLQQVPQKIEPQLSSHETPPHSHPSGDTTRDSDNTDSPESPPHAPPTSGFQNADFTLSETPRLLLHRWVPLKGRARKKIPLDGFVVVLNPLHSPSGFLISLSGDLTLSDLSTGLYDLVQCSPCAVHGAKSLAHTLAWKDIPSHLIDLSLMAYLLSGPGDASADGQDSEESPQSKTAFPSEIDVSSNAALLRSLLPEPSPSPSGSETPQSEDFKADLLPTLALTLHLVEQTQSLPHHLQQIPNLAKLYSSLDRPFLPVIYRMEQEGIFVDASTLERLEKEWDTRLAHLQQEIFHLAGQEFNLASPQQLGEVLKTLGLTAPVSKQTGRYKTDSQALMKLAQRENHPIFPLLAEWRKLHKLRTTYTETLVQSIHHDTHRIHTTFLVTATNTGRLASQNPNLQNIPVRTEEGEKIREAFRGEGDHDLASLDYSQIELRLLAYMGQVPRLIRSFEQHEDIHRSTASLIFGKPVDGVSPDLRRMAKVVNFGIVYGQTPFGLAQQLGISAAEAKTIIDFYFRSYPEIRAYIDQRKAEAHTKGYVETLFGRRCYLPNIRSPHPLQRQFAERQAINAPLQGTNADIMKKAMIQIDRLLQNSPVKMVLQIHDEIVFEGPREVLHNTLPQLKRTMESILCDHPRLSIPLVVNAAVGRTWRLEKEAT